MPLEKVVLIETLVLVVVHNAHALGFGGGTNATLVGDPPVVHGFYFVDRERVVVVSDVRVKRVDVLHG